MAEKLGGRSVLVESLLHQNSVAILKKKKNITPLKKNTITNVLYYAV